MPTFGGVPRIPERYCHPLYLKLRDIWRFYELSYLGAPDYLNPDILVEYTFIRYITDNGHETPVEDRYSLNSFLHPYAREQVPFYRQRLRRSWYRNLCQPTLDVVRDHALGDSVERTSDGAPALVDFWRDCDHTGATADEWMAEGMTQALMVGHMFGVADLPRFLPGELRTLHDEQTLGVRPYATWYTPLQVPDWQVDRFGRIVRLVLLEEDTREESRGKVVDPLWRILWPDRWEVHTESPEGEVIDEGPNPVGRVPVEVLRPKKLPGVRQPVGLSFLHAIAPLNQQIYNTDSMRDELKYRQSPFLAVPGGKGMSQMEIGTSHAFGIPEGASTPSWTVMPEHAYTVLSDQIAEHVLAIRALAGLSRGSSEASISARSGEALLVETQDKRAMLGGFRHEAEDFETRLGQLVADMARQPWTGYVRYSDRYFVTSFTDELAEASKFLDLPTTAAVKKEIVEGLVRRRLAHLGGERVAELLREPDAPPVPLALAPPSPPTNGTPAPDAAPQPEE